MFLKLENKFKRVLFLFFLLSTLSTNFTAFYTTYRNMHNNALQLSLSYAKQQEQSFRLWLQLLEETASLFLQHHLLDEALLSESWNESLNSLTDDYLQSSLYLSSIQIYTINGHIYGSKDTSVPLSYQDVETIVSGQGQDSAAPSIWYVCNTPTQAAPYGYLSYITGIYSSSQMPLGYLVFNIDLRRVFGLFDISKNAPFQIDRLAIQTESGQWISQTDSALFQRAAHQTDQEYSIADNLLVYPFPIPKSNSLLLMAVPTDTLWDYTTLFLICLFSTTVSIFIGYFAIRALSDSIILPLRTLYQKIQHFLNFKQ